MKASPMPLPTAPPAGARIRTLRGLSTYACGHSGSCCRAGWPIPVESEPLALLTAAEASGTLPRSATLPWMDAGILGQSPTGSCVFHAPGGGHGGCAVERALGSEALPYSCRQFPRLLLADARGWHQSLTAWCGTTTRLIISGPSLPTQGDADLFLSFTHIYADERV